MTLQKKLLMTVISLAVLGLSVGKGILTTDAAARGSMVMFSANWCASCRQVAPIVRDVAGQNGLSVVEIDVDSQQAPKQARDMGLSIPREEPPQVFFVDRGRASLLYSGKGFKFGQEAAVRAKLLQSLQQALQ